MPTMSTTVTEKTTLPLWKDGKNGSSLQFLRSFTRLEKEEPNTHKLIKNHIKEGYDCEDSEYKYHVGKSQYGMWLSRKKKPIFIPDPPSEQQQSETPMSEMVAVSASTEGENNNGNNNNNNHNSQMQEQNQEQLSQQQAQVYPYSVKIEQDSKGKAKISIHVYGVDADTTKDEAIKLFVKTQDELKGKGIAVLKSTTKEDAGQ
jgi:FtsZ-interacting cell division protein ZipA